MTALRRIETATAALAFIIGIGWPLADILLHAAR